MSTSSLPSPRFRISRYRRLAWWGSGLACLLSVVGLALCWLNPSIGAPLRPGLDFTGGTQIQLERQCGERCSSLTSAEISSALDKLSLPEADGQTPPNLSAVGVQVLDQGRSLMLRLPDLNPDQASAVVAAVQQTVGALNPAATSVNTIGPTLGDQLLKGSLISLLVSFAAIAVYISFRYDRLFAALALLCLAHDVLITCGVFAWLGILAGIEVDSLFAVSLITVAGYSVNDTVVVFDRIREQKTTLRELPLSEQVDVAVDATLTRSLFTSPSATTASLPAWPCFASPTTC